MGVDDSWNVLNDFIVPSGLLKEKAPNSFYHDVLTLFPSDGTDELRRCLQFYVQIKNTHHQGRERQERM